VRLGETGIGERGDIVLGWLVRLCVVILVAGLVLFDAISVGLAHMSVGDDARPPPKPPPTPGTATPTRRRRTTRRWPRLPTARQTRRWPTASRSTRTALCGSE